MTERGRQPPDSIKAVCDSSDEFADRWKRCGVAQARTFDFAHGRRGRAKVGPTPGGRDWCIWSQVICKAGEQNPGHGLGDGRDIDKEQSRRARAPMGAGRLRQRQVMMGSTRVAVRLTLVPFTAVMVDDARCAIGTRGPCCPRNQPDRLVLCRIRTLWPPTPPFEMRASTRQHISIGRDSSDRRGGSDYMGVVMDEISHTSGAPCH